MTINISMPKKMYADAKKQAKKYSYASISELFRDALRWWMNDNLTRNGFTPEFEERVLKSEKEADAGNVIEWDGKGSFVDWSQSHPPKNYAKNKKNSRILSTGKSIDKGGARIEAGDRYQNRMV